VPVDLSLLQWLCGHFLPCLLAVSFFWLLRLFVDRALLDFLGSILFPSPPPPGWVHFHVHDSPRESTRDVDLGALFPELGVSVGLRPEHRPQYQGLDRSFFTHCAPRARLSFEDPQTRPPFFSLAVLPFSAGRFSQGGELPRTLVASDRHFFYGGFFLVFF